MRKFIAALALISLRLKIWHSFGGRLHAARSIAPMQRFCSPRRPLSGSSMPRLDVRMSARAIKAKQGRLSVVGRG